MALTPEFNQIEVDLKGIPLNNPTSLQFGPDGRLYVSQQNGLIRSFNLKPLFDNDGNITKFVINNAGGSDSTDLVQDIPNHNDDGALSTQGNRQVTGIAVEEGPNGEVVLYVSSSDPRIGGGSSGNETPLDTNSGIISRLTKQSNGSWEKVDLVIGLPRSEENHSTNGLDIRTEIVDGQPHQIMYVVSGGNTNRGAPSNNFAWTSEYYYSAAVLRIDLTQLEQIEATEGLKGGTDYVDPYVYALPTLDDPTRPNNADGQDTAAGTTGSADAEAADTFGGNDGRNQAKYDPNGPVQVYSMGYRNAYDIVITENDNIYTFDNGPNNGWGDVPLEADGSTPITSSSQVTTNYPNVDVNTGNDTDPDNLHLVTEGFYAGHPNPVYASGAAAGLYWVDTSSGSPVVTQLTDPSDPNNDPNTTEDDLPADWNEIAGGLTNPEAGVYLTPGDNPYGDIKGPDGSLVTIGSSSNGLTEYIAGKFGGTNPITDVSGAEVLAVVAFNGNVYFMEIVGDGTQAATDLTDISPVLVGGTPLDVRDVEAFAVGTEEFSTSLFITQFGTDSIIALVPGTPPPTDIDKDDDGLDDNIDPLQYDPVNGTNTPLNAGETLLWDFNPADSGIHPGPSGEYNIGMTGWMINNSWYLEEDGEPPELFTDPALTDLDNTIRGGAPGIFQVKSVGTGDLEGTGNDQQDAIQTGFLPATDVGKFTVKVPVFNPFSSDANAGVTFSESASMGFSLGDGTTSNWIGIAVAADNSAGAQVKLTYEENDNSLASLSVDAPELLNAADDDLVELFLTFDKETLEVTPSWRYQTQGVWSDISQIGTSPVQLVSGGSIDQVLQGQNSINGLPSAPVITMTSTSKGTQPFTADFIDLTVATPSVTVVESSGQTQVTEGGTFDTYSLALSTQPTSDVTVTLSPDAQVTLDKTEVIFTPTNWAAPQTVTITAVDDSDEEGNHTGQITHQISTTDSDYSLVSIPNLTVDVVDNDVPQVILAETDGFTEVAEGGFTDTYSLALSTQPTSDVTVTLSPDAQVTLDQTEVIFTTTNWNQPQQVTVSAVDDSTSEGNHTGQITHQISTTDSDYSQVSVPNVTASIADNDELLPLYRINVGGAQLASADGSTLDWSVDTNTNPSPYRVGTGGANIYTNSDTINLSNPSLPPASIIESMFQAERWDPSSGEEMQWEFPVNSGTEVEVRLYLAEIYKVLLDPGQRVFDVAIEGVVPSAFNDIDQIATAGYGAFMLSDTVTVTDGILDLDFLHIVENPAVKGIEILSTEVLDEVAPTITTANSVSVPENQTAVLDVNATDDNGDSEGSGLTYQPLSGPDGALFTIDTNTGVLDFIDPPDFENPLDNDSDNVYELEVIVEDSTGLTDLQTLSVTVTDVDENTNAVGNAVLSINLNSNNVQVSNFGNNSFQISNTGDKKIAQVEIDVTNALYPDTVFDPFGVAGDTASKQLTINTDGGTGVVAPNNDPDDPNNQTYIGVGGTAGYEGIRLTFDEAVNGGFESGETVGFAVDMDPNSVRGTNKSDLDGGSDPAWDVGGVSGAELIGSPFTVTFTDGTTASGQLQGNNNQAGSLGLASQDSPNSSVSLTVNGLGAGGVGTYDANGPSVIVNGPAGETARVVLTKGFIQPKDPYAQFLADQLAELAATDFPANNAVEFQTVDVELTGADQDISGLFDYSGVPNYDFAGEDKLPLGYVASVIDTTNNNLPLGPVSAPIYLQFDSGEDVPPTITTASTVDVPENQTAVLDVNSTDDNGDTEGSGITYSLTGGVDQSLFAIDANTGDLSFSTAPDFEAPGDSDGDNVYIVDVTVTDSTNLTDTQTLSVNVTDVDESENLELLYRINVAGEQVNAADGSTTPWSEDTSTNPSIYRVAGGERIFKTNKSIDITGLSQPASAPEAIFKSERWDPPSGNEMRWEFPVDANGTYEIRLYFAETYGQIKAAGQRTFDIEVEGSVPSIFDDIDQYAIAGSNTAFMLSHTTTVGDNNLNLDIEFLRGKQNPSFKGVEIFAVDDSGAT